MRTVRYLTVVGLFALAAARGWAADAPSEAAGIEFFEKQVRPLLHAECLKCHGPDKQKGGLRLDTRDAVLKGGDTGPALVPGQPEQSLLIKAVRQSDDLKMPPKEKLTDPQIAALTTWIKMGAPWPKTEARPVATGPDRVITAQDRAFWSFQPVRTPPLPAVRDTAWPKTLVDRFILAQLEAKGLRPVEPADKGTLLRRVTFDLTGLPPTPAEIDAFLNDRSPDAFARVVDRLLASPQYGERWARHWLDVARYGEDQAHTFQAKLYPNGFRYRDWVVKALNEDMPYDQFVLDQIAGDLLDGPDRNDRLAALGYFALGPVYYGRAVLDELDDRVDTLGRGFLGLTVACARCHDHKFDPIPTKDYYALAGVFASTQFKEYPVEGSGHEYEQLELAFKGKNAEIAKLLDSGLAQVPKEKSAGLNKNQLEKLLPPEAQKKLTAERAEADKLKKQLAKFPVVHALTEGNQPSNMRVHVRGNATALGDEVPRHFLSVLCPGDPPAFAKGSGRLELARAIASRDNPLTARVIVNRIWQHHFGRGIVGTPSNFGLLGERPTHPELLDYLADRFMAEGWSIKKLHRLILLSATYQLSSRADDHNQAVDPDNRLLWRMNRQRLEVEAWRDAMLAVGANLDPTLGGPSHDLAAPDNRRRTLYAAISRHNLNSLLRLFDFPDPNLTSDRRPVTTVPLQQLFVLNSEFMVRQARALAARLTANHSDDPARIRQAFVLLYGRPATDAEVRLGAEFLATCARGADAPNANDLSPWEQYAQVLLSANEFAFVD